MFMAARAKTLVQATEQIIGGGQNFHSLSQELVGQGITELANFTHVEPATVSVVEDFLHTWNLLQQ